MRRSNSHTLDSGRISRRRLLVGMGVSVGATVAPVWAHGAPGKPSALAGLFDPALVTQALSRAGSWPNLRTLLVARHGEVAVERAYNGHTLDAFTNVKSVAKTVIAALTGAAIDRGVLEGVDQRIVPVLGDLVPDDVDPRVHELTVDHLLTMRAGLERTSGPNYGRWVSSDHWVRHVLSRPFVAEPGGRMLYSTGSYHVLSAVLTQASGRSTLELARSWLGEPLDIRIPPWDRDPQGFYFGGNNMALTPRALLRIGEMYRSDGRFGERRVLSADWVTASWQPRTRSRFTGHYYGYGWFLTRARGYQVYYGWGYGGQMVHVVPDLALTVVMTSDPDSPSGRSGYARSLHALVAEGFVAAAEAAAGPSTSDAGR